MERQEKATIPYVLVEITSAYDTDHIKGATLAIQSYASSLYEAASINQHVIEVMSDIDTLSNISKCSLNTYYNYTNPTTKEPRYQAIFDLVYMED
jgi:uncharacterized protein (DUF608 family)